MSDVPEKTDAERLRTPVQFLPGVGPDRAVLLKKLALHTAADVLFFFPREYQEVLEARPLDELAEGDLASVIGTINEIDLRNTGPGRSILGVLVQVENDFLRCVWFNQPWMREKFRQGQRVLVSGRVKQQGLRWEMVHPRVEEIEGEESPASGGLQPVYPLTEGLKQGTMRRIVQGTVEQYADAVEETLPAEVLDDCNLWPIRAALSQIHKPLDRESLEMARRRFVFQELLVMQLALAMRRHQLTEGLTTLPLPVEAKIDARIRRRFPFELTVGQQQAIEEITADMARPHPMNRLLLGDVGSGKTVVALYAVLLTVAHGAQAALMAPTEVLARQHFRTLGEFLRESRVRVGLLAGSLTAAERRETLAALAAGELDVVIGTTAIVQEGVQFAQLGLVVIDEQHKFGVKQRATLRQAGLDPHYLVMTATPIPRTVAMTQFGDLEVSVLRDGPPGRPPVNTYLAEPGQREQWWEFYRKKLKEGQQGYVITPLVDERDEAAVAGVEQMFETLANGELADFRLDLLHGRMKPDEKEAAMADFSSGKTQVLVATTLVEVGIDVPNATLMTIESGERFGLAALHQLRGRLARGKLPGFVCVFAQPGNDDARQRLEAFAATESGFDLAEMDFAMRGPGEILGTRQSGLPPLRVADLVRDGDVLAEARVAAQRMVAADPRLEAEGFERLRAMVERRYGAALDLSDVG